MRPQSAKAKGRRLQQYLRQQLLKTLARWLTEDDIESTSMGAPGQDLKFSAVARKLIPFPPECKNQENLNIWAALAQSHENVRPTDLGPLVVFTRNHSETYVATTLDAFLELLRIRGESLVAPAGRLVATPDGIVLVHGERGEPRADRDVSAVPQRPEGVVADDPEWCAGRIAPRAGGPRPSPARLPGDAQG